MKLYSYFRSSAAYRVRIALAWKGLAPELAAVHLVRGEQQQEAYRRKNPQGLVPALELDDGTVLTQSLAILEYLEETHPEPPLLPRAPLERARVRSLALVVACEVHPLNNVRVLAYLTATVGASEEQKLAWYRHWVGLGLEALEARVAGASGRFCHGDAPTLADVCLMPQLYNARRFGCDLTGVPTLVRIEEECLALPAFDRSRPETQPDAE
jgi:maleylacetoacetate isomerase